MAWRCLICDSENADSIIKCVCGYELPVEQKNIISLPLPYSINWIRAAWVTAFVVTFILLVLAFLPANSPQINAGYVITAFIIGVLGIGIIRGDQSYAWTLVIYQGFNTLILLIMFVTAQIKLAGISPLSIIFSMGITGIYTAGAIHLRRACLNKIKTKIPESQLWVRFMYEVVFLQAAGTAAILIISTFIYDLSGLIGVHINVFNLIDIGLLFGFGYAVYKQQTWGGYGLVIYQIVNIAFVIQSEILRQTISIPLSILGIYVLGVYHLKKLKIATTPSIDPEV